uniref:Uncharacterized protein n=1 Tax=Panagrellus redivivus TaxID=6233 RepID=A0A7E4V779_PANRE
MKRRKCSFIVELIFGIIFVLLLLITLAITGRINKEEYTIDFEHVDEPEEILYGEYYVTYPEDLDIDIQYILTLTCPGLNFYANDSYIELNIETMEFRPEKILEYTIIERSFKSDNFPSTILQGGIFADLTKERKKVYPEKSGHDDFNDIDTVDSESNDLIDGTHVSKADLLLLQRCITKAFVLLTNSEKYPRMMPFEMPDPPKAFIYMEVTSAFLGNQYLLNVSLTVPNEKLVEELHKQFTEKFQATGENPPTEIVLQWTFPKTNQTMSTMYKTLDEVVASTNKQFAETENNKLEEPSSNQSSNNAQKKPAISECMITGATLEDIFVKLAQVDEKTKGLIK